jgi:hypothetical protein
MRHRAVWIVLWALAASGCQEKVEQTVSLTQVQWEEVRANLLTEPPAELKTALGAKFDGKVELLGVVAEPATWEAGEEVKITWYWRALARMDRNYQIFVHLDHRGAQASRQGMDHHPVRELYQTSRWEPGQIIRDIQTVTLRADFPGGEAELWAGLWDPGANQRLELAPAPGVTTDGQRRALALKVQVKGKAAPKAAAPATKVYVARPLQGALTLDGKLDEPGWARAARTTRLAGTRGGDGDPGEAWAKVLYDNEFLYVGFSARDKDVWGTLEGADKDTWTEEVFELFLDPEGDARDYVELQVTPRGATFDARCPVKLGKGEGSREDQISAARAWESGMEARVHVEGTLNDHKDQDEGWTAELKIPLASLPGPAPAPGVSWRVNFYRFDLPRDAEGKPGQQVAWSWTPAHGFFHNVEHFGTLRFVGEGAALEPERVLPPPPRAPTGDEAPPDKPE